ncbi:aldo/keto reductase [Geminicoccaceae bacterium 1502E]|nr:aldo/keto reductase [Geminicoccaceae bacterium 1502E]
MHLVEANGAKIPAIGFGTWELRGGQAQAMVEAALEMGYRHIDTAQMYGNEAAVGAALRASGLPRETIFLTTKIWPEQFRTGCLQRAAEESLRRLGVEQVDLLLLHWPNPDVPLRETMGALNEVVERGQTRHAGVSNFTTRLLDEAISLSATKLVANQVEYHPYLDQGRVLAKLRASGMALTAYCPLARGRFFAEPVVEAIAKRHGRTPGQIGLRWLVQQEGVIAIPRSSKPDHARLNLEVFDFTLSEEEMRQIAGLARPDGRMVAAAGFAPQWDAA